MKKVEKRLVRNQGHRGYLDKTVAKGENERHKLISKIFMS